MMWDDDYLYIAAILKSDMEVFATYTERNSPIYHEDFEVFVDPASSCHNYKELEMNAINTVWNLMLDKPYMDGGQEFSGGIANPGDDNYYEVESQRTMVRVLEGTLNNADEKETQENAWAIEIALSHRDTLRDSGFEEKSSSRIQPSEGEHWRINFSRVEEKGSINWTWQKQEIWDVEESPPSYRGIVDMHQPNVWGYVRFGPPIKDGASDKIIAEAFGEVSMDDISTSGAGDPFWPLKLAAMNVYYAQRKMKHFQGTFSSSLEALSGLVDPKTLAPFDSSIRINVGDNGESYTAYIESSGRLVSINSDRLMSATNESLAKIQ